MRRSILALIFVTATTITQPVAAQGIPTIDFKVITNTLQTVSTLQKQINEINQVVNTGKQIYGAIGQIGTFNLSGLTSIAMGLLPSVGQFMPNPCAQFNCSGGSPDLSSFTSARSWVGNNFFTNNGSSSGASNADQGNLIMQRRLSANQNAAQDGYAMALTSRSLASKVPNEAKQMETVVNSADSLRGDVKANTAVLLKIYAQDAQTLSLLAALLEVQASQSLVNPSAPTMGPTP